MEVLVPAHRNMDIYLDVVQLAEGGLFEFQPVPAPATPDLCIPVRKSLTFSSDCFDPGETLWPSTCMTTSAVLSA